MSVEQVEEIVQFYRNNTRFRLEKLIPIIVECLEDELQRNNIPARVAARVKIQQVSGVNLLNGLNPRKTKDALHLPKPLFLKWVI